VRGLAAYSPARRETPKLLVSVSLYLQKQVKQDIMAKGPEKNTKNKALHTKLLKKKKAKIQEEKQAHKARLKALVAKMNEKKNGEGME
jgi:hypothetical protein